MLKQEVMHFYLSSHQKFYVAGAFTEHIAIACWFVEGNGSPQPDPVYPCNAGIHCKVLVLFPDTVYMISLPLQCTEDKDVIVQISDINSRELKLLYMKGLIAALCNDPDLANVV